MQQLKTVKNVFLMCWSLSLLNSAADILWSSNHPMHYVSFIISTLILSAFTFTQWAIFFLILLPPTAAIALRRNYALGCSSYLKHSIPMSQDSIADVCDRSNAANIISFMWTCSRVNWENLRLFTKFKTSYVWLLSWIAFVRFSETRQLKEI